MRELVEKLCLLPGVSGDEDRVREFIIENIKDYVQELRVDNMGSVIALKKGAQPGDKKVMLAAHMDEVGVIITNIGDDGYLKFSFVGGVDRRVAIGKAVRIGRNGVRGIIGLKAYHLVSDEEEKKVPKVSEMYIDIGAESREAAEKLVTLGDTGAFESDFVSFGEGKVKAKALDDRVGCAVLVDIIKNCDLPYDTYFAFTVQEEVGTRGAFGAAFSVTPDVALVVEGTTAADIPTVSPEKQICKVGGGAVIPFMDGGTIYNRELFDLLTACAEDEGIKWQTKEYIAGGTDASAIQRSRAGVKAAGIAVPVRYIHSPSTVTSWEDIEGMRRLAEAFLKRI